jgi:CRP-like cAMP-binding protein
LILNRFSPRQAGAGAGITYERDQTIFSQGDPADVIFYIQRQIKLTAVSRGGKEAVIAVLGAGDFFGEGCLAGQPLRMASAATMSG